jgi:hypothetical protein
LVGVATELNLIIAQALAAGLAYHFRARGKNCSNLPVTVAGVGLRALMALVFLVSAEVAVHGFGTEVSNPPSMRVGVDESRGR